MQAAKKTVYIETTIPSIITARPSRDIINAYRQEITRFFWENERHKYDISISEFVLEECSKGDVNAANRRMDLLSGISLYPRNSEIELLAEEYFSYLNIPLKAKTDCSHLAVCVIHKINYLMSWNMTHLGRPAFSKIAIFNESRNLWLPELVTPDMLMDIEREEVQNGLHR